MGLPPSRPVDQIPLKNGSGPINASTSQYAFVQKNDIETMVQDMLAAGIIWTGSSPFPSPVILVKEKDGSWRCADYRTLHDATITNKYPISIIEELLR